jgi:glycosyltransferase involved in cell wall biosynthesis
MPVIEIVCGLLGLITLCLLLYDWVIFARFAFREHEEVFEGDLPPVSVVLTVRDEVHYLVRTLPQLLSQKGISYEVVVVNDHSEDDIEQLMSDFLPKYPHLKFVNLSSSVTMIQGKKFPLSIGIKEASHDIILLTEANCYPASPYWVQNMAKHFTQQIQIVLGYATYEKKDSVTNLWVRFDRAHETIQFFGYALAGMPIAGNGKNLAYSKSLFYKRKGFATHNHIPFGDDDIFVNKAATKKNCTVAFHKDAQIAICHTYPFKTWYHEKKNYMFSRAHYRGAHRFLLHAYAWFSIFFYIILGISLYVAKAHLLALIIIGSIFFVKTLSRYLVYGFAAAKLNEKKTIPYLLIFDFIFAILYPFIWLSSKRVLRSVRKRPFF